MSKKRVEINLHYPIDELIDTLSMRLEYSKKFHKSEKVVNFNEDLLTLAQAVKAACIQVSDGLLN